MRLDDTRWVSDVLARVSSFTDETSALREGLVAAVESFNADGGAVLHGDRVVAAVGSAAAFSPAALTTAATVAVTVEEEPDLRVVLLRGRRVTQRETRLLRAIARVTMLVVHARRAVRRERTVQDGRRSRESANARQLAELLERQALLERANRSQRALKRRGEMAAVLRSVVDAARGLLGEDVATVWLEDDTDPAFVVLGAADGYEHALDARAPIASIAEGAALTQDHLVVFEAGEIKGKMRAGMRGVRAVMAAPLRADGVVRGVVSVGSRRRDRSYSPGEREVFVSFVEQASAAIADARAMQIAAEGALRDPLTGLPSRTLLLDRIKHSIAAARRTATRVGVLCIDLDRFTVINDGFGRPAGDEALQEIAARIRSCLRAGDTASRFAGDEFGVLLDGMLSITDVVAVAERILSSLRAPIAVGGREVSLGASVGIAVATGGEEGDELLRYAAVAMHEAKSSGRNRCIVFEPGMHDRLVERVELQADLERAVPNGELSLHYQPIVRLETGEITGFEALVRWDHPERGSLAPETFIPLAEDLGLIVPIDRFVIATACADLRRWQETTGQRLAVGVNLSARDFAEPGLTDAVADALASSSIEPDRLVIEITESQLLATDSMLAQLRALKELGVRIAIDDFGTGYSSLAYLQRFPVDMIKIDRAFVASLGLDGEVPLARAIVRIGQSLGIATVAEGVETEEQRDALRALGCVSAQGHLFSRAVPARMVPAMLGRARHLRSVG